MNRALSRQRPPGTKPPVALRPERSLGPHRLYCERTADWQLFLTASKSNGVEGRPFAARTTDGGLTWSFLSFIGPEPTGYSIMPSTVRISPTDLVTTIRRADAPTSWIDAYASHDDGKTWSFLSTPEPDTGEGNPPSLLRLPDGRLCLIYGLRGRPFGIYARISSDQGKTWSNALALRTDGGGRDIGYVRSILRPDGNIVVVYYYHDSQNSERYLAATTWYPGKPCAHAEYKHEAQASAFLTRSQGPPLWITHSLRSERIQLVPTVLRGNAGFDAPRRSKRLGINPL